jgi:hypothetical protein
VVGDGMSSGIQHHITAPEEKETDKQKYTMSS